MLVIGIDPGASGGIAILDHHGVTVVKMQATETDVRDYLKGETFAPRFAFIEFVTPMPKQGLGSTWKFGQHYGFLRGLLIGLQIPFEAVRPQVWQKVLNCRSGGDKNVTKAAAQQLWPNQKWIHATADAALIAEYGRRSLHERGML
jgi:crossover junction endodeoxyribonuclease RuvC